jgi:hypothetical protein
MKNYIKGEAFLRSSNYFWLDRGDVCLKSTKLKRRNKMMHYVVEKFDDQDWAHLMKKEPEGYSWREEAYLAGDDYIEDGKEFLRCN